MGRRGTLPSRPVVLHAASGTRGTAAGHLSRLAPQRNGGRNHCRRTVCPARLHRHHGAVAPVCRLRRHPSGRRGLRWGGTRRARNRGPGSSANQRSGARQSVPHRIGDRFVRRSRSFWSPEEMRGFTLLRSLAARFNSRTRHLYLARRNRSVRQHTQEDLDCLGTRLEHGQTVSALPYRPCRSAA